MEASPNSDSGRRGTVPLPSEGRPTPRMPLKDFENAQRDPKIRRAVAKALQEGAEEATRGTRG
jgi:hypothetical protein